MPKYQQIYVLPYGNIYPQAFCQPIAFPCGSNGKESTCNAGHSGSTPELGRSLGGRAWQSTPVFLPGESHGQRSLVGYSWWGRIESDTTEGLTQEHLHRKISFHSLPNILCEYWEVCPLDKKLKHALCLWNIVTSFEIISEWNRSVTPAEGEDLASKNSHLVLYNEKYDKLQIDQNTRLHWSPQFLPGRLIYIWSQILTECAACKIHLLNPGSGVTFNHMTTSLQWRISSDFP